MLSEKIRVAESMGAAHLSYASLPKDHLALLGYLPVGVGERQAELETGIGLL